MVKSGDNFLILGRKGRIIATPRNTQHQSLLAIIFPNLFTSCFIMLFWNIYQNNQLPTLIPQSPRKVLIFPEKYHFCYQDNDTTKFLAWHMTGFLFFFLKFALHQLVSSSLSATTIFIYCFSACESMGAVRTWCPWGFYSRTSHRYWGLNCRPRF